jgi:hypothetical protein
MYKLVSLSGEWQEEFGRKEDYELLGAASAAAEGAEEEDGDGAGE